MSHRIIIIGNGFDLAHGLKTSYSDFMEFLKGDTDLDRRNVGDCGTIHHQFKGELNKYVSFKYNPQKRDYDFTTCSKHKSYYFKNLFSKHEKTKKWSDLEMLYFDLIKQNPLGPIMNNYIETVNDEFTYLKELLEYYLKHVEDKIKDISFKLINHFRRDNIFETEYPDTEKLVGIINFNYTTELVKNYILFLDENQKHSEFRNINIHGKLESQSEPIIFGYGDDNSNDYKQILNKRDNKLIVNFKTFQYLKNSNYNDVLRMLNTFEDIQIEIIGHSCGLTDKTLLRTIFEHKNVSNIEYRYHSEEKYYFENLYNISRIFIETSLMRQKVIDFGSTRKIPQIELNSLFRI